MTTPSLLLAAPAARADILPPASTGFVAEQPPPPRLPPHPFPVATVGAVALAMLLVGLLLRFRVVQKRSRGG